MFKRNYHATERTLQVDTCKKKKKRAKFSVVVFWNVEKYSLQELALWAYILTMSLAIYFN